VSATQARLGFALGGAVIGGFFGVPGLGLAVGSIAGSLLFPGPDPPPELGPRLGDLSTQVSAYGNPIPWIFGMDRVAGNIIWNSTIREIAHSESQSGGGKGGSPSQETTTFEYRVDLCISLHDGEIDGIRRVWANDQLYYNFEDPPHARGINSKIYFGTETQTPDPLMEADKGVGNVPAYRGQAYIMLRDLSLGQFNNAIPVFHFEVIADGNPVIPVVIVEDVPQGGGPGRVTIDEDTGLIYFSRRLIDKVFVFSCNAGLNKICEVDHEAPHFLSWSPRFTSVDVDLLGTVTISETSSRVWVGSHAPDAQPGSGVISIATDASCRILDDYTAPMNDSNFCWPGMVFVDRHSINEVGANYGGGPYLLNGVTNGACSFIVALPIGRSTGGGLGPDPNTTNPAVIAGVEHTADIVQGGSPYFYGIDWDGRVWRGVSGSVSFTIDKWVLATASFANEKNSVTYDPDEDMVYTHSNIFGGTSRLKKWDRDLNLIWEFETNYSGDNSFEPDRIRYHKGVGDIWAVGRDTDAVIKTKRLDKQNGGWLDEFSTGANVHLWDFQPFPGAPFAVGPIFSFPGGVIKFPLGPGATPQAPTLAQVVTDIIEKGTTLTAADIDVTSLTSATVRGYNIAQRMPVRATLQPLMRAYFFDAVESDYKLKFVKRGQSPAMVIPEDDLSAHRGEETPDQVTNQRTQENELPRQLDVRFKNINTDYKAGVATTRRLIGDSQQIRTVNVPIVFDPTEGKSICDVVIHNAWFERVKKSLALSRKYLRLDPTDVITITDPDQGVINVRINQISFSIPGLILLDGREEDTTVYTGFTFPGAEALQPQPGLLDTPPVVLFIMDIPTLRDLDDNTGTYVVAHAIGGAFAFAEVQFSIDNIVFGGGTVLANEGAVGYTQNQLTWAGSFS